MGNAMAKTNPVHAHHCPDQAVAERAAVVANTRLARDTYRLRIGCREIARRFLPGQFAMIRLVESSDPLLGRPMAIYDAVQDAAGRPIAIDVVYHVVGKMTTRLVGTRPATELAVWGPLGNGFALRSVAHLILVAGGIGQTPFLALAREVLGRRDYGQPPRTAPRARRVTLCYGVRTREMLACVDDFQRQGVDVRVASDDGSVGRQGLVTDLLEPLLERPGDGVLVACCGPEPMMRRVAAMTAAAGVPCQVSLETPMACGMGICFSCVVRVRQKDGSWDYKRTCVEGPVFDAEQIEW